MQYKSIYLPFHFIAVSVLLLLCCFVGSCRSTQHTSHQTSTLTNYRDTTVYRYIYDTIHITKYDSIRQVLLINDSTRTARTIEFGENGSYNAQTGDMSGVKSISEKTTTTAKTNAQTTQISLSDSNAVKNDIDKKIGIIFNQQTEQSTEQEPKPCNHLRIFLYGLLAGVLLPYIIKYAYRLVKLVARAYGIPLP